jgi:hypothetical protein
MDPKFWLKSEWISMFSKALSYPSEPNLESQHDYKRYFIDLGYVLPGRVAAKYNMYLREVPIDPFLRGGRRTLVQWVLQIHNRYQQEHGGKLFPTVEGAIQAYFPNYQQ